MRGRGTHRTGQTRAFVEALRNTGNVSEACRLSGIGRTTAYQMRETDPAFAAEWDEAMQIAMDSLELEAWRRGRDGYDEYVTCKDGLVYDQDGKPVLQRRYSDSLLTTLLKAHRPEKYRDRSTVDMNVNTDIAALIDEGRKRARGG
ncbi:hypothetical protein KOEU_17630 [Komagataeibacter europaeus]|uniref:Terminase small subunit n=1 Tax=Komagataeibacter europaeus TaxID=33995 RepID=A0A0M0EHQ3_KOMEU|nr:hypothetical protein KOEU_17630 [Komagataeibacter europaeus]